MQNSFIPSTLLALLRILIFRNYLDPLKLTRVTSMAAFEMHLVFLQFSLTKNPQTLSMSCKV